MKPRDDQEPLEIGAIDAGASDDPASMLEALLDRQFDNAIHAVRSGLQTYESLRNVNEVVGGEYGSRVVFELFQNAHDAHEAGEDGEIKLRLVLDADGLGDLYVANAGRGFDWRNVGAIRNVAVSSKSVGEGIGNKGLGFRSVETLTDDPRIYSQTNATPADRFGGFCFRFASKDEVRDRMSGLAAFDIVEMVADTLPRYLAAVPLVDQDEAIRKFAREGFATVVHVPLRTAEVGKVAREQVLALLDPAAPLLLFLERLKKVVIEIEASGSDPLRETLTRTVTDRPLPDAVSNNRCEVAVLQPGGQRFLVVRRDVDGAILADAVERSVSKEPQLARWRDWRGQPSVAVAVPLGEGERDVGRVYNFLPMAKELRSPLRAHVDAPFYASIDRRRAAFDLPLNATLMDQLAETAAAAAVELKVETGSLGRFLVFDLMAWDPDDLRRVMFGKRSPGSAWQDFALVPAAGGEEAWTSVRKAVIWDEAGYRLFRARRLVKAGVADLADPSLGPRRLKILERLIRTQSRTPGAADHQLAGWGEALARSLHAEGTVSRTWSTFYDELHRVFGSPASLRAARGRQLLISRAGELVVASAGTSLDATPPVYVRAEAPSRRKDGARAGSPPPALARRYALLDEDVALKPETSADFIKAGLCRRYDAVELLSGISATFTDKPAPARREAALRWAFDVWRAEPQRAEPILPKLDLHVETRDGWVAARLSCFSEGWTRTGRTLETFLAEAASLSQACQDARGTLLVTDAAWVPTTEAMRREWVRFLSIVGVNDGLTPVASVDVPESGWPNWTWHNLIRSEVPAVGRDARWVALARATVLHNPNTDYQRKGELWVFPGQVECGTFAPETRGRLAELVLAHLAQKGAEKLTFQLGRYDRWERDWNEVTIATPAGAFVKSAPWMPLASDPESFSKPSDLWSTSDGRQRPRFVPSPSERLAGRIEDDERLRKLLVGPSAGIRDWSSRDMTVAKLQALALAAVQLEQRDRVAFRRAYQRGWLQAVETKSVLPVDLAVAASGQDGWNLVRGDGTAKPAIYVSADFQRPEARALIAVGQPILDVAEEDLVGPVIAALLASGGFDAKPVGQGDVVLVVDGRPFAPSLADTPLLAGGMDWLVDAAALANDVLGRELERQISPASVERRLRRVRVHFCDIIELRVDGAAAGERMPVYAHDDPALPTLIVAGAREISWPVLADAATSLSSLLDRRMRSLETLLLRLAARQSSGPEERPTDLAFAQALRCRIELVREHEAARRGSGERLTRLLVPAVACLSGLEAALELKARIVGKGDAANPAELLEEFAPGIAPEPAELLAMIWEVGDLAELRRRLGLDFGQLNRMLAALGEPILSNEAELRRLFDVWIEDIQPSAVDRLRRRYWADFEVGKSLAAYVAARGMNFVDFDEGWIADRETLGRAAVEERVSAALDALVGPDIELDLPDVRATSARSKRTLQKAIEEAAPVVRAWLHREGRVPGVWGEGPLSVMKLVDQAGLLDFAEIEASSAIAALVRVSAWPAGMQPTIDLKVLKIDPSDMLGEAKRLQDAKEEKAREQRTIQFAGQPLDTAAPDFAERLAALADLGIADGSWLKRSRRRFSLAEMPETAPGSRGPGPGGPGGRRRSLPTDAMRTAMGLASEYLVRKWLEERHRGRFTEASWVSGNREEATTSGDGDDRWGFDFRIRTVDHEWQYEVKSSLDDRYEFEFTQNEMRVAAKAAKDTTHKYRILYVPFVFDPTRWRVMELPNPMSDDGRKLFKALGTGATRFRFDPK